MDLFNDVFMTDPYQSLEADLDDVSEVIRSNCSSGGQTSGGQNFFDYHNCNPVSEPLSVISEHQSDEFFPVQYTHLQSPFMRDPNTSREIGSIVSQLQEDDVVYGGRMVNFKNFVHQQPQSLSPQSSCSTSHSLLSPPGYSVTSQPPPHAQFGPAHEKLSPTASIGSTFSPNSMRPTKTEESYSPRAEAKCVAAERPLNTKEELLALLERLTPAEVDKLRAAREEKSRVPPVVGVATKLPAEAMLKVSSRRRSSKSSVAPNSVSPPMHDFLSVSSDNTGNNNDSDMELDSSMPTFQGGPKTKRRTAHNLIEKKYRCSINDRIQQLKAIVAGGDTKLSKSAILRVAIDHIAALRQRNDELKKEVERLRGLLEGAGISVPKSSTSLCETRTTRSNTPNSISSMSASASPESSPVPQKNSSRPMVDKARVTMFAVMFMIVICNPISIFMGKNSVETPSRQVLRNVIPGRTLQQVNDDISFEPHDAEGIWWQSALMRPCFVWSVNLFIVICFLTRLLVYGEPVADAKSSSWTYFLSMKATASTCIRRWNYADAKKHLQECLKVLERPLPSAGFDGLISVVWQVIRHMLNSIYLGRWFSRRRRSAAKPVTVVCRSHAQTAIIYHQLNQLHLSESSGNSDNLAGLNLALSAVNLAESAGCSKDGLPHALRADVYISAALQMKMTLPPFIGSVISIYFMRRAKRHARRAEEEYRGKLMWLFHPLARRYISDLVFVSEHLRGNHNAFAPFVRSSSAVKPIERLTSAFKMEMLKLLVAEIISPSGIQSSYFIEVSRLLFKICAVPINTTGVSDSASFDTEGDELCAWWAHVFICALYWRNEDYSSAPEHYAAIRKCPKSLLAEPISLALGHAFCSRKLCLHDRGNRHFSSIVGNHVRRASAALQGAALSAQCMRISNIAQEMSDKVRLLSLEWLLMSVFDVWHSQLDNSKPYWQQLPSSPLKCFYEDIFMQYRMLAEEQFRSHHKLAIFELTLRFLTGSNPVETWQSLSLSECDQRAAAARPYSSGQREHDNYPIEVLQRLHSQMNFFNFKASQL